jgi:hypothetical protein
MAFLRLRMIGCYSEPEYDIILKKENESSILNLKFVYLYLMKKSINIEKIKQIKFISNGKNITNLDEELELENREERIIYLFTNDQDIKNDLTSKAFVKIPKQKINQEIKPTSYKISTKLPTTELEDHEEEIYQPTEEEIEEINSKILESLGDENFTNLLRICIQKPEMLNMVNSYLKNGNIIDKIDFDTIELDNFSYEKEYEYISNYLSEKLSFEILSNHQDIVRKTLLNFNGHLNLSIRYLINLYSNTESV